MATIPTVSANTSIEDLFGKIMPDYAKQKLAESNAAQQLAGTEITMVVNVGSKAFSYTLKDGAAVTHQMGDMENPMLRIKISEDDLKKMIETNNLDMILGMMNELNKAKYNALKGLKGSFIAEVSDVGGSTVKVEAILNGAQQPQAIFKMNAKDTAALMRREANPVNLFMSGAMKIEGDMSFAMATQPLFT
ncbi:MAG: SCP2 sterol-binding domain-containing protein [Spirochaetes bacterium]|nr:SCP2 sterol-binding domain-containing protein [Spirochaetota bacterium]